MNFWMTLLALLGLVSETKSLDAIYQSCYDGDTFTVDIADPGNCIPDVFAKGISVRVDGVDTPEIKGECQLEKCLARKARDFTESRVSQNRIGLDNPRRDKYFRLLATVKYQKLGESKWRWLAEELISAELAVIYHGKTKETDWCNYSQSTFYHSHTFACRTEDPCVQAEYQQGYPLSTVECNKLKRRSNL